MKFTIFSLCLLAVVTGRPTEPQQKAPLIPKGFEVLPEDAKDKLIDLHFDKDLTFEERRGKIEEVLDEVPHEVLKKLPLAPGLERLPEEKKEKFRELHLNRGLDWRERHQLVQKAIKELPVHEQRLVESPRPMTPPTLGSDGFPSLPPRGFEFVLPVTIYKHLIAVHQNPTLSVEDKKHQIDRIMSMVPQDQLNHLPLPPNFDRLDASNFQRLSQIMHNFQIDWDTRHQNVKEFIAQLPLEQRRLLRPPSPGFEVLPDEVHDQIDALFMNEKMSPAERNAKVGEIIQRLPEEIRSKLPSPLPFLASYNNQKQENINDQQ